MKKTGILGLVLVYLLIATGFAGCIGSDPVVGTWSSDTLGAKMVFNADKTVTVSVPSMGVATQGKWENMGNGQYTVIYPTGAAYTTQISKDGKTMTSGSGYLTETYVKVS